MHLGQRHAITSLLFLLIATCGVAATVTNPAADSRYRFRHLDGRSGIPYTWVWHINQDSRGYMWFSTMYGTYRYDGYRFEEYSFPNQVNGVAVNVNFVVEDTHGELWFGTDNGLYRHDPGCNTYTTYAPWNDDPYRLSSNDIYCAVVAADGALWAGTGNGLNRIDPLRASVSVFAPPDPRFPAITAVVCRNGGSIWFGDSGGNLWRLGAGNAYQQIPLSGVHHSIKSLFEDNRDRIWIGTEGSGLLCLDVNGLKRFDHSCGNLSNDIVRAISQDNEGRIWVGTEKGITIISDDGSEFLYTRPNDLWGLNDNAVYSLCRDRDDMMWVGTFFGGVNMMNSRYGMFADLLSAEGQNVLKGCAVSTIFPPGKKIYIGTENRGLFVYDTETASFRNYTAANSGLSNDNVHSVSIDRQGNLWVGNYYGGMNLLPPGSKRFRQVEGLPRSASVYSMLHDATGNLWVGTFYGGLYRYDESRARFERFTRLPGDLFVWDILEDYRGNIWIACYGKGIYKLEREQDYQPLKVGTPSSKYITLCALSDGRILAGTEKEGLTSIGIDDLTVIPYTRGEGLPDNTVYGIQQDQFGDIWLSTNSGIYKSDSSLTHFTGYTIADGLPTNRFNYNASARHGGLLYFGSVNGVVLIDPSRAGAHSAEHPVRLGNLYISNEKQEVGNSVLPLEINDLEKLVLMGDNHMTWSVDFSCNVFDNNAIHYAYRLEGMDDKWHMLGNRNRIDFTGLGFGYYRLTVCVLDDGGQLSDNRCELAIFIRPPWWRSVTAKIVYVVLALLLGTYLLWLLMNNARTRHAFELERLEREKDKQINEMKLRFFVNISHEFKTPLSLIIGPVDSLLEGKVPVPQREKYFGIIKRNAEKMLGLINELLAFRELEHLKLRIQPFYYRPFLLSVLGHYGWLFESKNIRVELECPDTDILVWADADKLEKMLGNLLSNASRYTPLGGEVKILATEQRGGVATSVINSGPGISPEKLPHIFERFFTVHTYDRYSSGVGLSYVKSLVEMHHGTIEVDSQQDSYTRFTLWLPSFSDAGEVQPVDPALYDSGIFDGEHLGPEIEAQTAEPDYLEMERQTIVLVVDASADMRNMLIESLSDRFRVEGAANAAEALEAIADHQVDILVSDVILGEGMNGFELCKAVKGNIETSHIRVILITVLSEINYREQGYKAGADAYVTKPIGFPLLALCIRNLLYNSWKARKAYKIDIDLSNMEISHTDSDEQLLKCAVTTVFDHLSDSEFNVDELCRRLNVSQSTLYRKLKVTTGQSTNEFIQNIRLRYAARLLKETSKTISEITFEVGFSDSSYFSRAFRKCFGCSPKQWREKRGEE